MKEDIFEKVGKHTPYSVPEKYLDNFTAEIMRHYNFSKSRMRWHVVFKYAAVAAILIFFAIPSYFLLRFSERPKIEETYVNQPVNSELFKSIERLSDEELVVLTSLLDDDDIYKDQF
jgi:hypothetical protein